MRICISVTVQHFFRVRGIHRMVTVAGAFGSTVLLYNLYNWGTMPSYYKYVVGGVFAGNWMKVTLKIFQAFWPRNSFQIRLGIQSKRHYPKRVGRESCYNWTMWPTVLSSRALQQSTMRHTNDNKCCLWAKLYTYSLSMKVGTGILIL